ncbi:MAG TPA: HAMP domain-containing sensor histidine kinase [Kiloniellales bacterium]|nr:HAMP domain-containing sensor histidine kinase [Kiloniellales bacterium]
MRFVQTPRLSRSATFRFALVYALLFSLTVLLLFGGFYWSTAALIERQVADTVAAELRSLADRYREEGIGGLQVAVQQRSAPGADPENVYLLADRHLRPVTGNLRSWPEGVVPDGSWWQLHLYRQAQDDGPVLVGARAFQLSDGSRLLVGRDMQARREFQNRLLQNLAFSLTLTLVVGVTGGVLLSRRLLRRVDDVSETSRRIMEGDLTQRVPQGRSNDEFDRLAESLNRMLERIEALMNGMRLVTDSLAHDLRSPLTRLKGKIELTLLGPENPEAYRQALEQALAEIDIIQATFNDLLAIAEAESGASRTRLEPLSLDEIVADVAELYRPVLEDAGMQLDASSLQPATILGHRQLLAQALANLLDNAVKYADQGERIEVNLHAGDGQAILSVRDYGPGIPEEARERVLERFVRLDAARSRPGSGLGLSLVAAVSRLHHAQLELKAANPGLLLRWTFRVAAS